MRKLKLVLKYYFNKLKGKVSVKAATPNGTFNISADMKIDGGGKGADIWGTDWPIPVAEELEWSYYQTVQNQYIRTKLTDYILWIFPFSYDEYIYQMPKNTIDCNHIDNKLIVDMISDCENWNHHDDMSNITTQFSNVMVWYRNSKWPYELGNNDYQFITKHN